MNLTVIPLTSEKKDGKFSFFDELKRILKKNKFSVKEGDVLVISSKFLSNSQGRILDIEKSKVCQKASKIAKKFDSNAKFMEIVYRESDNILGGVAGFVMSTTNGILAPNAGIDKSNSKGTKVVLYPEEPYKFAEDVKRKIFLELNLHVGVIIVDSRLMPARIGTTGVAIACAGIEPTKDLRGEKDLDGNPLKVTFQATADNLASIANHKMGEGDDLHPIAIVRDSNCELTDRRIVPEEMIIPYEQCVYIRSFSN
ncbi:MAG: coenzyme F420-0:L-glutamate ligase [Thermoproteota archaeon]|jgi:coenzyme F420-0:L-glutamate ligase/coenzyme F420-1:gamma-L-glutamate ligase|nr:coenzyme F420-0:L-glutamate ligase [Thermoproteota archaeon]MEC9062943.1 coenzyme F420-0:L-glutamate ligase [Thermoproteota archaeon]|tara:strand:- start:45 stop:809 length:765 start_codon:yes stop_codon:yes gene_type:complete